MNKKKESLIIVIPGIGNHKSGETVKDLAKSIGSEIGIPLKDSQTTVSLDDFSGATFDVPQQTIDKDKDKEHTLHFRELHWNDLSYVKSSKISVISNLLRLIFDLRFLLIPIGSKNGDKDLKRLTKLNLLTFEFLNKPLLGFNLLILGMILTYLALFALGQPIFFSDQCTLSEYSRDYNIGMLIPILLGIIFLLLSQFVFTNDQSNFRKILHKVFFAAGLWGVGLGVFYGFSAQYIVPFLDNYLASNIFRYKTSFTPQYPIGEIHLALFFFVLNLLWGILILILAIVFIWVCLKIITKNDETKKSMLASLAITTLSIAFWLLIIPTFFIILYNILQPDETFFIHQQFILETMRLLGWVWMGFFAFCFLSYTFWLYRKFWLEANQKIDLKTAKNAERVSLKKMLFVLFIAFLPVFVIRFCLLYTESNNALPIATKINWIATLLACIIILILFFRVWREGNTPKVPRLVFSEPLQWGILLCAPCLMILVILSEPSIYPRIPDFETLTSNTNNTALLVIVLFLIPIIFSLFSNLGIILDIVLDIINYFTPLNDEEKIEANIFPIREKIAHRLKTIINYEYTQLQKDFPNSTHELIIVAHSQGTIIALDYLEQLCMPLPFNSTKLITMGSPFQHLYQYYFHYHPSQKNDWDIFTNNTLDDWVNIFRIDDYVGTNIPQKGKFPSQNIQLSANGHTGYFSDCEAIPHINKVIF